VVPLERRGVLPEGTSSLADDDTGDMAGTRDGARSLDAWHRHTGDGAGAGRGSGAAAGRWAGSGDTGSHS
jgi:hypothetical protein